MGQIIINTGNVANDGLGTPLRNAFDQVNYNFTQLFNAGPSGSNIVIANNSITVTNANGNLNLATNGIGSIVPRANFVPDIPDVRMLGAGTNRFNTVYAQYINANTGTFAGNVYVAGNLQVTGNVVTVDYSTISVANSNITLATGAANAAQADGGGLLIPIAGANFTYDYSANSWNSTIAITAPTFIGDGANLTNVIANVQANALLGNTFSNSINYSNLTSFGLVSALSVTGNLSTSGNVYANVVSANSVIANYLAGNGSNITNITANAIVGNVPFALVANTAYVANLAALATQAINADTALFAINANLASWANTATTAQTANAATYAVQADNANSAVVAGMAYELAPTADLSVMGNITTGGYFIGDGGLISNIVVTTSYGNSNVSSYLENLTSNVSTTGNITADGNITGGNILTGEQVIANGEIQSGTGLFTGGDLSVNGSSDLANVNVSGNLSTTGNITGNYFIGDGSQLTGISGVPIANSSTPGIVALGNGFTVNGSNQVSTSSLYSTNLTQPTQHYALQLDTNGVVILPDQSIINGSTLRAVANSYAGITTDDGENSWMWVDSSGAYIATQYNEVGNSHQWTFDNTGNLTLPANTFAVNYANGDPVTFSGSGNTGNVTFDNNAVVGTGDEYGYSGLYLAPGANSVGNVQYLRVRGGDYPTHIHLDTGNNQYFDQYFGADSKFVKIEANGNIVINADNYAGNGASWTFGADGTLALPVANGAFGLIATANAYPELLAYGSGGGMGIHGGPELDWMNSDDPANAFNDESTLRNTLYINGSGLYVGINENGNAGNFSGSLFLDSIDGNLTIPGNLNAASASPAPSINGFDSVNAITFSAVGNISSNSLAATGVVYAGTDGQLTTSNSMTFADVGGEMTLTVDYFSTSTVFTNDILGSGNSINVSAQYGNSVLFDTTGGISATGNVTAANFTTSGSQGNITGANVISAVTFSASGNITAGTANLYAVTMSQSIAWPGASEIYEDSGLIIDGALGVLITSPNLTQITSNVSTWNFYANSVMTVPGAIRTASNSQLELTETANTAYLGTTADDSTALYLTAATAQLYANGEVSISSNVGGGNTYGWAFDVDGNTNIPGDIISFGNIGITTNVGNTTSSWTFDNTGNLTTPGGMIINGNTNTLGTQTALLQAANDLPLSFIASGANGSVTSFWAEDFANLMTSNIAAIYTPLQNTQTVRIVTGSNGGNIAIYDFDNEGMFTATAVCATGNVYAGNVTASGNVTAANFIGNGNTLSNVATQITSSWTLAAGTNTVSLTVPTNGTYSIWVNGNIPNGIVTYTATVVVTNTNVPVVGSSYGWYYAAGNALVLTAIPTQIVGTVNNISNAVVVTTTANVFEFTIVNNSGNSAVVNYGYTKLG